MTVLTVTLFFSDSIASWLSNLAFIKILDALSKLGVLIGVTVFLLELPKREERIVSERKRSHFEYWKAIDAAAASGTVTSYARKIALEELANDRVSLRNIDAPNVDLKRVDLTGADLVGANFTGADFTEAILDDANLNKAKLYRARLYGTSLLKAQLESTDLREVLYDEYTKFPIGFNATAVGAYLIAPHVSLQKVKLSNAILWSVNLQEANLEESDFTEASFRGAMLKNANFQRANLKGAKFGNANLAGAKLNNANIQGANFWNAKGLTIEQVKSAQNWETAEYSKNFCEQLGLSPRLTTNTDNEKD
ncbi:pentapeptide repeat-containing protein [Tolypothrix sp. LEGE 11397]|uniref:pentapeptide repeat-containing protein n=1 Tax=unclassified Tolypothrix TaxID=2649714 RepID=UPI001880EF4E|nr:MULTISPECIES: pentapeptide repeat-containing protein [unclassified Tolypothrix]MBE9086482.1 pentapeptide repeat-containing protein [Tolypothrix sp. LEGE 11397]UYD26919.1 pentapeptide repeat-containing protein [Tolypothrix sp. PCC 7712]UYD37222.1 pentapeptide repeat-containing protein [Tolypothrix sp. PCC 7601]